MSNTAKRPSKADVELRLAYLAKRYQADLERVEKAYKAKIEALRGQVTAYESLPLWRRMWLLIHEPFGKRKPIIEHEGVKSPETN